MGELSQKFKKGAGIHQHFNPTAAILKTTMQMEIELIQKPKSGRKLATLHSTIFVGIFLIPVACLLTAIALQRIDTFREYHKTMADNTVSMVANEIIQRIGEKRRLLHLFTRYEQQLIRRLMQEPDNSAISDKLQERVLSYFPDAFAFTLADADGKPFGCRF